MHRAIALLFAASLVACSARVEHDRRPPAASAGAININSATADELERLPGIGRRTAEAIVEFRSVNGPFRRIEHLLLVRGVSERRFVELRPLVRIDQPAE